MSISVNWATVEDKKLSNEPKEFKPLPEGVYNFAIEDVDEKVTRNGDPMFNLKLKCIDEKYKNRVIFTNLVFSEKGLSNVKALYKAIFGSKLPKECSPEDILGEVIAADVYIRDYNGKEINDIYYAGYKQTTVETDVF